MTQAASIKAANEVHSPKCSKCGATMRIISFVDKEHRLIERMISRIGDRLTSIESGGTVDPLFIDTAVDFIRVYADRTHHGKEEDILFRDLDKRALSDEDRRLMNELIEEHTFGRRTTQELVAANDRYRNGEDAALRDIAEKLRFLTSFYPRHIEKEDKTFFPAARRYFTDEEDSAMLAEFYDFDKTMIHRKHTWVVEKLESRA